MSVSIQGAFPARRMRRMRKHDFSRRLMAENQISVNDLIYPMFILMGKNRRETVDSMPGIERLSIDLMLQEAEYLAKLGVPAIALFPVVSQDFKTVGAEEAYNPEGLVQRAVRLLKEHVPQMGVITDVTLKIFPLAEHRIFEALKFDSVEAGTTVMRKFMRVGLRPFLVRFYDVDEAKHAMQDKGFDSCVMFLGFEGVKAVAEAEYDAVMDICTAAGGQKIGPVAVEAWMRRRFDFSTVENLLAELGGLAETIEISHFWDGILNTYYKLKEALAPYADEVLGHFSHVYPQGTSLYVILLGHAENDAMAEANILKIWETAMNICLETGSAISHHHGVGMAREPYIRDDLASSALVLDKVKNAIDPAGVMNPGKLGLNQNGKT